MELEYIHIYYNIIFGVLLGLIFLNILLSNKRYSIIKLYDWISIIIVISTIYYIGSREYGIGIDTLNYKSIFDEFSGGAPPLKIDFLFYLPFFILAKITTYRFTLYILAFLYLYCAYKAFEKLSPNYHLLYLLAFIVSPYFFQYGINGLRNGIACSIFLLGLAFLRDNKYKKKGLVILLASCGIHLSLIIPTLAYFTTKKLTQKNGMFIFLLWSFMFVLTMLGFTILNHGLFLDIFPSDSRFSSYLMSVSSDINHQFLVNYLQYGLPIVILGFLFIYILKNTDVFYFRIYYSYLIIVIIYLLLISMPYANRIAYLSDFLIPILIIYPLLTLRNSLIKKSWFHIFLFLVFIVLLFVKT